jgi:transposase
MARRRRDRKAEELAKARTLNPHPEAVVDAVFASSEFFDAQDLVQVKYEMVRRVEVDGVAVNAAARSFGFSRQSYYTAAAALAAGGLPALVPARPGPRRAHKLSEQVLDHLEALRAAEPKLRSVELAQVVADRFEIRVHPRSVERALTRRESARSRKSS